MPLRGHVDVLRLFASIGDYPDNDLTNVASRELEGDPDAATSSRIGSSSNNRSASAKQVEGLDGDLARSQSSPTKILKLPMGSVAVPVLPLKEDQTHHSQSQIESKLSEDCQVPDSDETQRLGEYRQRSKDILPGGHWNVDSLRLADKIIQDRKSTQSYALGMPDFSLETGGQNTGDQVAVESNQASEDVSEADVGTATVVRYTPYKRKKTLSPKTSAFLQDRLADISLEAPKSTDSSDIKASVDISSLVEHAVLTQVVYGDCSVSLSAEGGGRSTGRYQGPFGDANVNKASTSETGLGKAWKSFSLGPEGYAVDRSNTSSESASVVNETIRAGDRLNDTAPDSNRCSRKGDKIFESYQSTDSPKAREGTQHPVEPELTFRSGSIGRGVSELPFQGATREFSGKTSHQNSVNNQHSLSPDLTSEHSISYIPHIPHTTTNSIGSTSTTTSVLKHNTSSRNSIQSRQVDAGVPVRQASHYQFVDNTHTNYSQLASSTEKMLTSRGQHSGTRGRGSTRSSRSQDAPSEGPPGFLFPRTPSVSSTVGSRRTRGYQPAEVNKPRPELGVPSTPKSSAKDQKLKAAQSTEAANFQPPKSTASSTATGAQPKVVPESKISSTSVLSKKTQPPVIITLSDEEYSQDGNGVIDLDPAMQAASTEASRPKPVSVKTVANDKVSLNEPSSVKATKTDKHTHQNQSMKSSHSKQPPIDTPPSSQDSTPKAGWDNSTNPIDNPLWAKDCASRAADERGIINFHNLPKQTYSSPVSSSFNRQMANIKQTSHSTQVIQPPGTKGPASEGAIMSPMEKHIMNDFPKTLSAKPRSQNESSKAAPHMKAQIASVPANPGDGTQESEVKAEKVAPHLRKSISNSQAGNQEQYTETTAEQTIAAVKNYTPPPHLQGHRASKASANRESRSGPNPAAYWIETGPKMSRGNINIDEELAAVQHIADTESNAEVTAAMAEAEVRENDERIAAALQEESSQNKSLDTPSVKVTGESQERPNSIPPHLRKPKPKALTLNTELKTPSSSSAVIQPRKSNQDHQGSGETNPTRTRKGTTKAQQNATVAPPSSGVTLINGVVSTVWKGREIEKGIDPDNDPSKLVGWDGKMVPALLGDDWEDRRQYNSKGIEKLSNIEDWTVTHAADKENGITGEEGIPTSPVGAKHPETLPNPDEFNQAKRHLSAHTAIEAFAKRSASGKSSSPVEDGATREGRRTNRRLKKEKHTSMELPPNEYAPAANIYLRPADMQDMRQVASLHNHYVRESTWANEVEEWDELYWRSRLQECYDERDPFLVAIHTGDKAVKDGREVHRKKNKSETVVGFAFASDYGLSRTAYRFTVEVELWVHPDHRRQGIGRSMLDRILTALDPGYIVKECAPFRCKDRQEMVKWGGGGVRTVKTLLINMLYTETCEQALEWRKKWLSDNQFDYQGTLSDIGYKFSRLLHQCQMTYKTTSSLPRSIQDQPIE